MKPGDARMDALTELVGLGIGRAADVLNTMLRSHIVLSVPSIRLVAPEVLRAELGNAAFPRLAAVEMGYSGGISGSVELIFPTADAGRLVDCLTGDFGSFSDDLDEIRSGTLSEVGNIVINAILGTISNELGLELSYSVPAYLEGGIEVLMREACVEDDCEDILLARARFQVEELRVEGDIAVFFAVGSLGQLEEAIDRYVAVG